jgi:regulatory protein YycI of two-component signal transduction system YycFG
MDWSKIKTIFIVTFLILDVYLLYQFMNIRDANKYELITETPLEEKLKADDIQVSELPKAPIKDQYLSAKPKTFTKGDIGKLTGQTAVIEAPGTVLQVTLDKPYQLAKKFDPAEFAAFLKDNILYGDHYLYGEKSEKRGTITYYQQYDNLPLYKNISGMIIFNINEENQVVSYQQTYLEDMKNLTAEEELLQPLNAIETLHQKGLLKPKSKIKVELGYSTLLQLTATQVLAPTWRVIVNDDQSLFVNAFEGQIIEFTDETSKVE